MMKDWLFTDEEYICDLRAAGVLIKEGKLLVQRDRSGSEYALPGGHVRIGEVMTDSLTREFMEEMSAEIVCKKLLWTEECFWETGGRKVHNISFYYQVELCPGTDIPVNDEWVAQKDNSNVLMGWIPIGRLEQLTIYPEFIKRTVRQLDAPAAHFITHT